MSSDNEPAQPSVFRRLRAGTFITIVVKLAILVLLYTLFFSPAHRPHVDAGSVADHIFPSR